MGAHSSREECLGFIAGTSGEVCCRLQRPLPSSSPSTVREAPITARQRNKPFSGALWGADL